MKHLSRHGLAAMLFLLGGVGIASAQPQAPMVNRPAFSPYLGLMAGGNPAFSYFGFVQPQMQLQQQFGQIQQQVMQNNLGIQQLNNNMLYGIDPNMPLTGHTATFMNYSHYYYNSPAQRRGGGGASFGGSGLGSVGAVGLGYGGYGYGNSSGNRPGAGMMGAARAAAPAAGGGNRQIR